MKKLAGYIDQVLIPLAQKFGVTNTQLLRHWKEIVGEEIATMAQPEKVTFTANKGTLYLLVQDGGSALKIQFLHPLILDRIRLFLGERIIHMIKIKQCS